MYSILLRVFILAGLFSASVGIRAETAGYTLSYQYATVQFRVMQEEYINLVGRFNDFSGSLQFDPEDLSATRIDGSVVMTSLDMTDTDVQEVLLSSSVWFNAYDFTESSFTTLSAEVVSENTVLLHGELTLRDITLPWTLQAVLRGGEDGLADSKIIGVTLTGSFSRSAFGMDQYLDIAADEVTVEVNAKFEED